MSFGLPAGTSLVVRLALQPGNSLFFRALAVLHKADSTPRSAGSVPRPQGSPNLSSVQLLSSSLAQRDLSVTAQQGPGR